MVPPLDLFSVKDGKLEWLGCAETLSKAFELAIRNGAGSYFAFSQETGHKNFFEVSSEGAVTRIPSSSEDAAFL